MHILITALHRPLKPTGVCRHAANLAQCLADTESVHRVTVVVGAWQRDYFKSSFNLNSDKIHWIGVDIKNNSISRNLWFLFGLPRLIQRFRPDIVHHSFPLPFFRFLFSCPIVTTIHDLYPYECPKNFGSRVWFNRLFLKQSIHGSDGLSCVSKTTLEKLKFYFPQSASSTKTAVVYNYVDFSQISPRELDQAVTAPFLLCVAQHRKNKNLDILVRAYALLLENQTLSDSTQLVIVGSPGPETDHLLKLIQSYSLQDRVRLLSSLDDRELCWLYKTCEVFVIPSSTEGFCLPLVEALYLSCKVVCSNIPIFQEVGSAQSTFFSLQGNAVQNLAQAIETALHQAKPDNTLAAARFSKANTARQYLGLYAAIAPQLSHPPSARKAYEPAIRYSNPSKELS